MLWKSKLLLCLVLVAGCSRQTGSTSGTPAVTPALFNTAGAPTVEFSVPDMMCPDSCAVKTKEILSKQPGAKEVVVHFDAKTATVAVEEGTFDPQQAIAALVDHGFGHSQLKSAEATPPATSQ
jgi:copper chaperone CopZ